MKKPRNTVSCIPGRIIRVQSIIRGTTRFEKPCLPSKACSADPLLHLTRVTCCPSAEASASPFRQPAPERSLYRFPPAALSVGDAAFLLPFPKRVSFMAFFDMSICYHISFCLASVFQDFVSAGFCPCYCSHVGLTERNRWYRLFSVGAIGFFIQISAIPCQIN